MGNSIVKYDPNFPLEYRDLDNLYSEDLVPESQSLTPKKPNTMTRRNFTKCILGTSVAVLAGSFSPGCRTSSETDWANESQGLAAMYAAADEALKGYDYSSKKNVSIFTDRQGWFDLTVYADISKSKSKTIRTLLSEGIHTLVFGMNYITNEDQPPKDVIQGLTDNNRYKLKEIVQAPGTTEGYLKSEFANWMKSFL